MKKKILCKTKLDETYKINRNGGQIRQKTDALHPMKLFRVYLIKTYNYIKQEKN